MTAKGMLFDTSPIEDLDGKRSAKKPRKKDAADGDIGVAAATRCEPDRGDRSTILASVEGHYECESCGLGILDLIEVRKDRWVVCCGWNCLTCWEVDPVPGLLDERDKNQQERSNAGSFKMYGGEYDGRTLQEIWEGGDEMYVKLLAKKHKRKSVCEAAKKFLETVLTESKYGHHNGNPDHHGR